MNWIPLWFLYFVYRPPHHLVTDSVWLPIFLTIWIGILTVLAIAATVVFLGRKTVTNLQWRWISQQYSTIYCLGRNSLAESFLALGGLQGICICEDLPGRPARLVHDECRRDADNQ